MFRLRALVLRPLLSGCPTRSFANYRQAASGRSAIANNRYDDDDDDVEYSNRYNSVRHNNNRYNNGGYNKDRYNTSRFRNDRYSNDRFDNNRNNNQLEEVVDEEELEKLEGFAREREVVKNVYKESFVTGSRSDAEIRDFMAKHTITVEGPVPKPTLTIAEVECLPANVKEEFNVRRITTPTPIQSMCWPVAMSGTDMIGIAQTGSGKTLGYLLPSALHMKAQPKSDLKGPTALVLAPTRELAQQISKVSTEWLSYHFGLSNVAVYGGSNKAHQVKCLKQGTELCIATPGRLIDLLDTRMTSLANSSLLILDEADRMLDMGFEPQIRQIIDQMRKDRQTMMFSATWPKDVRQLATDFMDREAVRVNIGSTELCANSDIRQEVRVVEEHKKRRLLLELVHSRPNDKILIFAATKRSVSSIAREMLQNGIRCVESHGDLTQLKRERALEHFKGRANVLVATDVAARGLDVHNISLVINVDFPQTVEDYVHRIGRTGRSGTKGEAITFFTEENAGYARGLIEVLIQAEQEVPEDLKDIADRSKKHNTSFRERGEKPKVFSRLSKSANWRWAAKAH